MSIAGAGGMMLVVFHPDAGSGDAEKLALLASAAMPSVAASANAASVNTVPANTREHA